MTREELENLISKAVSTVLEARGEETTHEDIMNAIRGEMAALKKDVHSSISGLGDEMRQGFEMRDKKSKTHRDRLIDVADIVSATKGKVETLEMMALGKGSDCDVHSNQLNPIESRLVDVIEAKIKEAQSNKGSGNDLLQLAKLGTVCFVVFVLLIAALAGVNLSLPDGLSGLWGGG